MALQYFKSITIATVFALILTACAKSDYTYSIPSNSTALLSMNGMDLATQETPIKSIVTPFLDKESTELKGIDLTQDVYFFVAGDGTLGFCASVSKSDDLDDFLSRMGNIGGVTYLDNIDGVTFYRLMDKWIVGYNYGTLLVMGPVVGVQGENALMKRMNKLFDQHEENSITQTDIWKRLQNNNSPIKMVTQANALPEQVTSFFTLGAPKGTDPADIIIDAGLSFSDSIITITGNSTSYNERVKQELEKSQEMYRPLTIDWEKYINDSVAIGVFMNVNGKDFIPCLQSNKHLSTLLMGSNAFDKIRDNDGNIAVTLKSDKDDIDSPGLETSVNSIKNDEQANNDANLIVCINIKALSGSMASMLEPIMGKVNRIIYKQKSFKTK